MLGKGKQRKELSFLEGHCSHCGSSASWMGIAHTVGALLPGRALLTVWKLSSGRAALPVGGDILRQESGSDLSLPGEVTTLGNRLDWEGLTRKITCMSFVPGASAGLRAPHWS